MIDDIFAQGRVKDMLRYRGYVLVTRIDGRVQIWFNAEEVCTEKDLAAAKKVVDDWHNAR